MPPSSTDGKQPVSLVRAEQWTLHHILLHRLERGFADSDRESPPIEVFHAFTTLDAGEFSFTDAELRAIVSVLAEYHHSTDWWVCERSRIESLLRHITYIRETGCRSQSA